MNLLILVAFTIISFGFSQMLFSVGKTMLKLDSLKASLERYEKDPQQATWIEKYFYGWAIVGQRPIMKALLKGTGDKFMTGWYRVSGVLFMLFSLLFMIGPVAMWVAFLAER